MRRRTWIKRSLLAIALVLSVTAGVSYWAFKGTPDYYVRASLTPEERTEAANRAIEKFRQGKEWANDVWVREHRSISAGAAAPDAGAAASTAPATLPATAPARPQPFSITFSDQELNAFLDEWASGWEQGYKDSLTDPAIILRKDRIILAGTATDLGAVASFHFVPRIDERGQLLLTLDSVRAGRMPMPQITWASQRDRLLDVLRRRLPAWQAGARMEPNGIANLDAVAAHMSKLLFAVAQRRPHEPVLFIPFDETGRAVPVRLTAVQVTDGELTVTVEPMTAAERLALIERIREPAPAVTASAE